MRKTKKTNTMRHASIRLSAAMLIALSLSGAASAYPTGTAVHAAAAKQSLTLAGGATYYGQAENGLPDGRGTIRWPGSKTYSGSFEQGKRSGMGKYINAYTDADTGFRHKIVYTGTWANDRMNGEGTWTHKRMEASGRVILNEIRTGVFRDNAWSAGYEAIHAEADPEYGYTYKDQGMRLNVLAGGGNLLASWKKGELFGVAYQKGAVSRGYSIFPEESAAKERERQASIRYLKSIASQVAPHLQKFEQLSRQLPLK